MKKALRRRAAAVAHRVLSAVLSGVFASSVVFGAAPLTAYATTTPEAPAVVADKSSAGFQAAIATSSTPAAPSSPVPSPTVVRELENSRTVDSSTYLMSDGSFRTVIDAGPVHYKDGKNTWQCIDPSLVPTSTYGVFHTKASAYDETIASDDVTDTPVRVRHGNWSFGMRLLGGELSNMTALGDTAVYPLAMRDTKLTYETLANGTKDTLTLSSKNAPDTFTFFMPLENLAICQSIDGSRSFKFFDTTTGKEAGTLAPLTVFDSACGENVPGALCTSATLDVRTVSGGAYVTYKLPRDWMDDPARVYPVQVDPTVTYGDSTSETWTDTFIASGAPTSAFYSDTKLDVGWVGSYKVCRTLIKFNMADIQPGATITDADLKLKCYTNTGSRTVIANPVNSAQWPYNVTWNTQPGLAYSGDYITVSGTGTKTWSAMARCVQEWYDGTRPNYGLMIYDKNDMTLGSSNSYRQYRQSEYGTSGDRPQLVVTYENPSISSAAFDASTYKPGDKVTATVRVTAKDPENKSKNVELKVLGTDSSGATVQRVQMYWSASGGFSAGPSCVASGFIVPDLDSCKTETDHDGRTLHFVYAIGPNYGDIQNNHPQASDTDWAPALNLDATGVLYSVNAAALTRPPSAATTASAAWAREADGPNDTNASGRGSITATWPAAPSASGYAVYLFDGNAYMQVGSTTATGWSSAGKGLYPTDTAISNLTTGTTTNPFLAGTGLDLRDDPRALYAKTAGTGFDTMPSYALKVVPFNTSGSTALSEAPTLTVELDNRTKHLRDEPRHTEADLGDLFGDTAAIRADAGDLTLSSTDLSIPGPGPEVALTRVYRSSLLTTSTLTPGWRFGFERRLPHGDGVATYFDEAGDAHVFTRDGGAWVAPKGGTDVLTVDGSDNAVLKHKDLSTSVFDTTGQLVSESDAFGNTVSYEWAQDRSSLVIRSPKSTRHITVNFTSGKATSAVAHVGAPDADRVTSYTVTPAQLTVTALPGTDSQSVRVYRCDASGRISAIAVPGFSPSDVAEAVWNVSYPTASSISVSNGTGAGTPAMPRTVSWDASVGVASVVSATGTSTLAFDPTGEQISSTQENTSAATVDVYDADGNQIREVSPTGRTTSATFDGRGNELTSTDEIGAVTRSVYDANDLCVSETDARGSVTTRTYYEGTGALKSEDKTLNATQSSHVEYVYNADGTTQSEIKAVSKSGDTTRSLETVYSAYADCGRPETTTQHTIETVNGVSTTKGVETAEGVFEDIVTHACYDGFGCERKAVDALGTTTASNTPDAAGRVVLSADATNTVTHTQYGILGGAVKTWRTNSTTSTIADWKESAYDGAGNVVTETVKASDGSVVATTTREYDAAGREIKSDDSAVPGAAVTQYDGQGNEAKMWEEGADTAKDAASTRTIYNAEGEETQSTGEGSTVASSLTSYTAGGAVDAVTSDDGSETDYEYGAAGDRTSRIAVGTDAGDEETDYVYDLDGRLESRADSQQATVTIAYGLDGNTIGVRLGAQPTTAARHNALGRVLCITDFDGVVTKNAYDANGRVVRTEVGGLVTTITRDDSGRMVHQANPDGTAAGSVCDVFGRQTATAETSGGAQTKSTSVSFDGAGRVATSTVWALPWTAPRVRTYSYAPDGNVTTTETRRGGDAVMSSVADGTGLLRSVGGTLAGVLVDWAVTATDTAGRVTDASSTAFPVDFRVRYDEAGRVVWSGGGVAPAQAVLPVGWKGAGGTATSTPAPGSHVTASPMSVPVQSASPTYVYDTTTGMKRHDSFAFHFAGRSEETTYTRGQSDRLASAETNGAATAWDYDPVSGAMASYRRPGEATTTLTYDGSGRLTAAGALAYHNDSLGHRTSFGPSSNPSQTVLSWRGHRLSSVASSTLFAAYTYDASGQRTASVVRSGSAVTTTTFDYDGLRLLGLSVTSNAAPTATVDYVYDERGVVFAGVYRSGTDTATPFILETTDRGDVRELLDSSGTAFAYYAYDAYGRPTETTTTATTLVTAATAAAIASTQRLRYAGYAYDSESGYYYCSQRYYDPAVGAFISKDPAKSDGEESAYQYCGGEPVSRVDVDGRNSSKILPNFGTHPETRSDCFAVAMIVAGMQAYPEDMPRSEEGEAYYWHVEQCEKHRDTKAKWPRSYNLCWPTAHFRKQINDNNCLRVSGSGEGTRSWQKVKNTINAGRSMICGGFIDSDKNKPHVWNIGGYQTWNKVNKVLVSTWDTLRWVRFDELRGKGSPFTSKAGNTHTLHWRRSIWGIRRND